MLTVVPRQKLRDVVIERLKSYICSEGLKPGDRLPNETELAATFGVSRPSLREATKGLELLGIIESRTGVGLTVGQVNLERITGHLGFHADLQNGSPSQLIDTRIVIETGALPYAARRMAADPSLYDSLRELADRFEGSRDVQERIELDIAFHRKLLDASGLAPLVAFNDLLQIFFRRFRVNMQMTGWQFDPEEHRRIIDALRDQDVARAIDELRNHIEFHKRLLGVPTSDPRE